MANITGFTRHQGIRLGRVGYTGNRGSAAAPAYSWEEDTNTGIYSSGADSFEISTGGTLRATVAAAGITVAADFLGDVGAANNVIWIPSALLPAIYRTTGTWTNTRIAAGNYVARHTAADDTGVLEFPLAFAWGKSAASKGLQLLGFRVVYSIASLALDAHTYDILDAVYADNTAVAVGTAWGGTLTGTLATATQAQPYVTAITTGTDSYITDLTGLLFQETVNAGATSDFDSYGIFVDFNWTA